MIRVLKSGLNQLRVAPSATSFNDIKFFIKSLFIWILFFNFVRFLTYLFNFLVKIRLKELPKIFVSSKVFMSKMVSESDREYIELIKWEPGLSKDNNHTLVYKILHTFLTCCRSEGKFSLSTFSKLFSLNVFLESKFWYDDKQTFEQG